MPIIPGRHTVRIEDDFVVFMIGMRINRLLQVHKWMPMLRAMPAMLGELNSNPQLGMVHTESYSRGRTFMSIQYWRSFDQLEAYAHAKDLEHLPAWAAFNRRSRGNTAVGIFHETYLVAAGKYECIHVNMPRQLLMRAATPIPVNAASQNARMRLAQVSTPPL